MMATTAIAELDRDSAARHLVAHASRRGFAIAFDLLGSRAEAEDAVQDALVRTLTDVHRLRDADALEGWFFRVLANACIGALRRRRVARGVAAILGLRDRVVEPVIAGDHARLLRELDRLPAKQKAALVLRYGHDLPVGEVAAILGVAIETAKTHCKRGRARLRTRMGVDDD